MDTQTTPMCWCPKCRELDQPIVYQVDDIHGELLGVITNALNGYAVGTFKSGDYTFDVHLGVPLCPYCEEPIDEAVAPVVNLPARLDRIAEARKAAA